MILDQLFNKQKEEKIVEFVVNEKPSLKNTSKLNIKMFTQDYEQFIKNELEDLKNHNKEMGRPWLDVEEKEINKELDAVIKETRSNLINLYNKIKNLESKILEKWCGSSITIIPNNPTNSETKFLPVNDFSVGVINNSISDNPVSDKTVADFIIFSNSTIDDVLEAGDLDFFQNTDLEHDYFRLVNLLQNPNYYDQERLLTLYTARPKKDQRRYNNVKFVPSGIFLSSSLNEVEGIAQDMDGRIIFEIIIDEQYLTKTLDRNGLQHYQTIGDKLVPIKKISFIG